VLISFQKVVEETKTVEQPTKASGKTKGKQQVKAPENDDYELLGLVRTRQTNPIAAPAAPGDKKKKNVEKQGLNSDLDQKC
jgi:hypothetical protein